MRKYRVIKQIVNMDRYYSQGIDVGTVKTYHVGDELTRTDLSAMFIDYWVGQGYITEVNDDSDVMDRLEDLHTQMVEVEAQIMELRGEVLNIINDI